MRLEVAQDLTRARCYGFCEGCGGYGLVIQVHHRQARGMGGVSRLAADHSNDPRNMLALCMTCHNATEDAATWRECEEKGWRVEHGSRDPWEVPALIYTVNGYGWWHLTEQGGYAWADLDVQHRLTWREDESGSNDVRSLIPRQRRGNEGHFAGDRDAQDADWWQ